jgi:PEGA domain
MSFEPSRMLETRHADDAALCREIERFKARGPTSDQVRDGYDALRRDLGIGMHEPLAEADSGVRVLPRPLFPERDQPKLEGQKPCPEAEPEFKFWTNATVSRTLAAFAVAALLALLWSRADRLEEGQIAAEQGAESERTVQAPSEQVAEPGTLVGRAALPGQDSSPQAAPVDPPNQPVAHARGKAGTSLRRSRGNAPVEDGKLNINSIPYSRVVLDGRPLGATPRVEVAVSPGAHTVVFVHPEHGRIFKEVYVDAGRTVLAAVRFD